MECARLQGKTSCACSPLPSHCRLQISRSHRRRRRRPIARTAATASILADGVLRLDTRTGQVSQCSRSDIGWACKVVPDERSALETEIARLQGENTSLKKELLARGLLYLVCRVRQAQSQASQS